MTIPVELAVNVSTFSGRQYNEKQELLNGISYVCGQQQDEIYYSVYRERAGTYINEEYIIYQYIIYHHACKFS